MKPKSKWKGAVLLTLALVLALSLAVPFAAKQANDNEAEAADLTWGLFEGVPALGLPQGAGALIDSAVIPGTNTVFVLCDQFQLGPAPTTGSVVVYRSNDGGLSWMTPTVISLFDDDNDRGPGLDGIWFNADDTGVDEDPVGDANGDGAPGVAGVDDDGDGVIDEGAVADDDEDGFVDEDRPSEVGVAIVPSPGYAQDGTVHVLTYETWTGATGNPTVGAIPGATATGFVYTSTDQGVSFPVRTAPLPNGPLCMAADPNFSSLLSGGTLTVGTVFNPVAGASVFYETWQSPVLTWAGAWTAVPSNPADAPDTLALKYAPTSALRLIAVQRDLPTLGVWAVTGSIATGFPALVAGLPGLPVPGVTNNGSALIYTDVALGDTTSAVIGIGQDYDPVSSAACPNCPMYMYVGTDDGTVPGPPPPGANQNGSLWWFDPTLAAFVDLKAAATIPSLHRDTSGVIVRGQYVRAEVLSGCANTPITYKVDVRTMVWDIPVFIEGCGGPIGTPAPMWESSSPLWYLEAALARLAPLASYLGIRSGP
jgi:hypothetical protein